MKKLILCVDRDDDIGSKTGIETPILGREDNLDAAVKLGLEDPEDSDTNSILSAISTYDDLKEEGEDVEIATVCGDQSIGYKSDLELSKELDEVLDQISPETVILVSDGAEDEYITPIVSSKADISHVKTVYVKQSESVENLYYMIVKSLQEEKGKRKILLPLSLALLVYGLLRIFALFSNLAIKGVEALSGLPGFGVGLISLVLGLYLMVRIYDLDKKMMSAYQDVAKAVSTASVWLPFTAVAILIVLVGGLRGWDMMITSGVESPPLMFLIFTQSVMLWWIGAILLHELGQVIHLYLTQGKIKRSFWAIVFSLLALTAIFYAGLEYIRTIVGLQETRGTLPMVIAIIILGLAIAVLGGVTQMRFPVEEEEEEAEQSQEG